METATAVEIDKGRLRQLLLDDFHKRFGKAFAKTAPFTLAPSPNTENVLDGEGTNGGIGDPGHHQRLLPPEVPWATVGYPAGVQ